MDEIKRIIDELMPLSEAEQAFQYIYKNNIPYRNAESLPEVQKILAPNPTALRIVSSILNDLHRKKVLTEKSMFAPGVDILVNTHPRFHPPFEHSHDFFEIMYVLKGSFKQTIANYDIELLEGDFCFLAPNVPHTLHVFSDDVIVVNMLIRKGVFSRTFANLLTSDDLISKFFMEALYLDENLPFLVNRSGNDENILYLIAKILSGRFLTSPYSGRLLRAQFEEMCLYILKDHAADFTFNAAIAKSQQKIISILTYIQQNYATVTLSNLADHFSYNSSYLSRILRKYTGKTFSEIVQDLRFEHVILQLENTNRNIEDIILETGYTDRTFFYREFHNRYGMSPGEYRKDHYVLTSLMNKTS